MRVLHLTTRDPKTRGALADAHFAAPALLVEIAKGKHAELTYVDAATVDCLDMEVAFEKTNSIDCAWASKGDIHVEPTRKSLRSTSVGDLMVHDHKVFAVAGVGFTRLDMNPDELVTI